MIVPAAFVAKRTKLQQKESALYASHFEDVCRLVGHATPTEHGAKLVPEGKVFSFQTSTTKAYGQKGFADVFYRGHFIGEFKGLHVDLGKAYSQILLYREALENPPLLIASDICTIRILSNFTNRPTVETVFALDDITDGPGVMFQITNVYAIRMAGVFMISLGTIWLQTGFMHRGWAFVTYALALALLVSIAYCLWVSLVFPGWVLAVSVYYLLRNHANRAKDPKSDRGLT